MDYHWFQGGLALAVASIAAYTDWRAGLIPNRLTLPALVLGLLIALVSGGGMGAMLALCLALCGGLIAALVPLLLFRVGAMGGGDVKLFAALGVLLGARAALEIQGLAFGIGALQGIGLWIARGQLRRGLWATATVLVPGRLNRCRSRAGAVRIEKTEIRFGPAIGLATVVVVAFRLGGLVP